MLDKVDNGDYHVGIGDRKEAKIHMAAGLIENQNIIQSNQLEDVEEYIQFLKTLNKDEKREFRGMIHGMQIMRNMMQNNAIQGRR